MSALTDYAQGKPCLIRIPECCTHIPEQTVACHVPLAGYHGTGLKVPDFFIAFGCFNCHDAVDHRRFKDFDRDFVRRCHLEGMFRTQAYILEHAPHLVINMVKAA